MSGCVTIVLFFFFFKQKTAYEILTCDWSSDVCSSDLSQASIKISYKVKAFGHAYLVH